MLITCAAMGQARFLLCTGFFRFFLSVTRPKPPLGQITIGTESRNLGCLFAKSCWNNDVREMLRDNVFFVVNNIYFSLGFFEALDSKGILNSLKKGMTSAMECTDVASFHFHYVTSRIVLLQVYFTRSNGH